MNSLHRMQLDEALKPLFSSLPTKGNVLDIGGGENNPYKSWTSAKTYWVLDSNPVHHPDICGDVEHMPIESETCDIVIATELLEHCQNPAIALREIHRVLKKGGYLIGSVPFLYQYHGNKSLSDYARFTHEGIEKLLQPFLKKEIISFGSSFTLFWTLIGGAFRLAKVLNPLLKNIRIGKTYSGVVFFAQK